MMSVVGKIQAKDIRPYINDIIGALRLVCAAAAVAALPKAGAEKCSEGWANTYVHHTQALHTHT